MGLYARDSLDLLGQLIKRDNPGFKGELNKSTVLILGGPYTSGLGASGRNTRIVLNGKTGSGVVGKKEFFYDRLNLGQMFNGITVVFAAKGDSATVADLLPSLNEQYGLGLQATDVANGATKLGTGYSPTPVTLTIAPSSVAYTGSLSVLWTRTPVGVYPDSGPGSKTLLVGNLQEGYFGVVSDAELLRSDLILFNLNNQSKTNFGSNLQPSAGVWYKFAKDNKVYYLPSAHVALIRWSELYKLGAVYETETPESEHKPTDKVIVPQTALLNVIENGRPWYLSPCLPKVAGVDPWPIPATIKALDADGDAERLFKKITTVGTFATGEWDVKTIPTASIWHRTTDIANPANALIARANGDLVQSAVKDTAQQWWSPMLELVDLNATAVVLVDINYAVTGRPRPPLLTISREVDPKLPVRLTDIQSTYNLSIRRPLLKMAQPVPVTRVVDIIADARRGVRNFHTYEATPNPLKSVSAFHPVKTLRPIGVTATSVVHDKINLSTTNNELDGFK